ncbi:MAG: AAA family ATPase, partial [Candidatus Hydrogenedentota bacterium]
ALQIVTEVCRGLEHGHARGIIHRDIKPGNIYLGEDGTAHLGDFGLAIALDRSRITQEGMLVGTAAYMAPEQAVGGEVTPRADIYAVGCVLYELLTGRPPFLGDDPVSVISQHLNTAPIAPTWRNPEISPLLEALILDMLSKVPDDRPATAAAVRGRFTEIMTMPATPSPAVSLTTAVSQAAGVIRQQWGQFVGRTEELAQLRNSVDAALGGKASVMMLVGEPGIGKTRTAEELTTYARMRGAQVLWGRCHEGEGAPAYWPWIQIIRDYVHGQQAEALRSEMGSGASDIAQVVSAVRERLPDLPEPPKLEPEQARFRLFDSITTFLHNASAHQPLVLIFDDLHWADKSSLLLFQFLARQLRNSCLFILGTYRDVELDRKHPLAEVLSELRRERLYSRVLLTGFSVDEVIALLEAMARQELGEPARALAPAIHRETEGNPFFVEEIILHLLESEAIYQDSTGQWVARTQDIDELGIPDGVREVVGRRLSRLSDPCNEALTMAAVVGREFDQGVIEQVSGLGGDELLGVLEEAERAGLISEMANLVGRYRFTHAIIRETLYEELSTPRRVRFHRQIGEVLESLHAAKPEPYLASLAYHFAEGARAGGEVEKAIDYAVRAAEYATEQIAYEQAVAHYERALEAQELQQPPDELLRCNLLLALGFAFVNAGDPSRAEETFFKTIDIARKLPAPEQLAEALRGAFDVRVEVG